MNSIIFPINAMVCPIKANVVMVDRDTYKLLEKFYQQEDGRAHGAVAMALTDKGRETIYIPLPDGKPNYISDWTFFDRVLGHEVRHILKDQYPKLNIPDPDEV